MFQPIFVFSLLFRLFARITFICGALLLDIFFTFVEINKRIYLWKIAYPEDCFIGVDALLFTGGGAQTPVKVEKGKSINRIL